MGQICRRRRGVPDELVLLGGQRLELEGKEVLRSGRRINYLVASRLGDHFRIETDDGVLELSLPIQDFESRLRRRSRKLAWMNWIDRIRSSFQKTGIGRTTQKSESATGNRKSQMTYVWH